MASAHSIGRINVQKRRSGRMRHRYLAPEQAEVRAALRTRADGLRQQRKKRGKGKKGREKGQNVRRHFRIKLRAWYSLNDRIRLHERIASKAIL